MGAMRVASSASASMMMMMAAAALSMLSLVMAIALVDPVTITSTETNWGVTLTVEMSRWTNTHMSFTTRQFCYQGTCTFPGPTIRVKPGDTFNMTVINNLGLEPSWYIHNTFHSPNSTNIHTHGLHIDPNVDSVFIRIPPGGGSHTYVFKIPADHFPGTHWYHTHMHGNSALQVMGGLYGMLIVDALAAHNLPTSITSAPEHQIVLGSVKWNQATDENGKITQGCCFGCACNAFQGCADTTTEAPFAPFRAYSYPEIAGEIGDLSSPNPVYHSDPTFTNTLYVNGLYGATLAMVSGTPHYLRILYAGTTHRAKVEIQPSTACTMTAVAADGVYFDAIQTRAMLTMLPATRYDIMLKCTASASLRVSYGERNDDWSATALAITVSGSSSVALPTTAEMAAIVRPAYLQSLLTTTVTDLNNHNEVHFSQGGRKLAQCGFWLGMGSNCSRVWTGQDEPSPDLETCSFEQMPGNQGGTGYASSPPTGHYKYVTTTGSVNEWRIYGLGTDAHPFHLHVHHFQIVDFQKLPSSSQTYADYFTIGEWRDTLPALDAKITIRFRAMNFPGESVLHCHVLRHEDLGMMSSVYICDASSTGGLPANGCPARNQSAHVFSPVGYNTDGTYDVSTGISTSTGSGTGSSLRTSTGGLPTFSAAPLSASVSSVWMAVVMLAAVAASVL